MSNILADTSSLDFDCRSLRPGPCHSMNGAVISPNSFRNRNVDRNKRFSAYILKIEAKINR